MPLKQSTARGSPDDFVAIDFETANYEKTSACAVGLAVVQGGKVVETFGALIRPEPFYFFEGFTAIHGITAADVEFEPDFSRVWPEIERRIAGRRLLAHNAGFDRSVLKHCLRHYRIAFPQPQFVCTVRLARAAFPGLDNHRLDTVCRSLKVELQHHRADSDAHACAQIALHALGQKKVRLEDGALRGTDWR